MKILPSTVGDGPFKPAIQFNDAKGRRNNFVLNKQFDKQWEAEDVSIKFWLSIEAGIIAKLEENGYE